VALILLICSECCILIVLVNELLQYNCLKLQTREFKFGKFSHALF
jgi:hypothetical protein